jgi:hypothetical protein
VVALSVAIAFSAPAAGSAEYPTEPYVAANSARAFGDSVGVTVRFTWNSTAYGNFDAIESRLRELGVRYVTDGFCPTCKYQIDRMNRLAALGIRATIGVSGLTAGLPAMDAALKVIRDKLLGSVVSVTAPNEPDISGDPQWAAHARTYQQQLYARVKGDPALRHLLVLGPPLVYRTSRAELGDISAYLDRGNIHPYPGGIMPMTFLDEEKAMARLVSGTKPLVATETGYHNDLSYLGVHRGASEQAAAMYTPRSVLEAFRAGVERTYIFQLIDAFSPQQEIERNTPGGQNAFGLLHWDFSRKPAFNALRNLLRVVDGDSAPVASPGGLRFGLEGAGPDVRQLLLRSADGSYSLVLWRQVSVWDRDALKDLNPAPDSVDVVLGERMGAAQRFDPVISDAETARWSEPRRISVSLAGSPVVLRLTPAAGAGSPAAKTRSEELKRSSRAQSRRRLRRRITVKVACAKPCASVVARGRLVAKRSKRTRTFKLGKVRKRARGGAVVLHLRVPARARRVGRRTLKQGGQVRARVTVVKRSASGAKLRSLRRTIALRR